MGNEEFPETIFYSSHEKNAPHEMSKQCSAKKEQKQVLFERSEFTCLGLSSYQLLSECSSGRSFFRTFLSTQESTYKKKYAFTIAEVFSRHSDGQRRVAFTLAEVLITLGIIGIVAAMTMPALIQKHERQVRSTSIAKLQSILSQVALRLSENNGGTFVRVCETVGDHNCLAEKMLPYLKYTKYCPADSSDELCKKIYQPDRPHIILEDGMMLQLYFNSPTCEGDPDDVVYLPDVRVCASVVIDINGLKTPNSAGKDKFGFSILSKGQVLPWGSPKLFKEDYNYTAETCYKDKITGGNRNYCTYCYLYGDCKK